MTLDNLSEARFHNQSPPKPVLKLWPAAMLLAAFLGFLDATYLTVKHFLNSPLECSLLAGCETVTTSAYATIGPAPISLLGAFYYLAVFLLLVFYFDKKSIKALKLSAYFTIVGLVVSTVLVLLQAFVIKAWCLYCVYSAITSTLLFILGMTVLYKLRRKQA